MISNSIWFASLFALFNIFADIHSLGDALFVWAIYVSATVSGGTAMHYISMRWLEKGNRRIGTKEF